MDIDRWRQLSQLFHEASSADAEGREAIVRRASADDVEWAPSCGSF